MATITIQVETEYDVEAGFKLVTFSPSSSTSNRISIAEGDTVVFHYIGLLVEAIKELSDRVKMLEAA